MIALDALRAAHSSVVHELRYSASLASPVPTALDVRVALWRLHRIDAPQLVVRAACNAAGLVIADGDAP